MTQIERWQGDLSTIDHTFGDNDWLITPRHLPPQKGQPPQFEADPIDSFQADEVTGPTNPSAPLTDAAITSARFLQPGDRLFRLPNGGVIMRRSLFSEYCTGEGGLTRFPISDAMASAVGFFGTRFGLDRTGEAWCQMRGEEAGVLNTPINVSESGIRDLQTVLNCICEARAGRFSPPDHLQDEDRENWLQDARDVISRITDQDVHSLQAEIDRRKPNRPLLDWIHQNPLGSLGIAIFGFHYGQKLLGAVDAKIIWPAAKRIASRLGPPGGGHGGPSGHGGGRTPIARTARPVAARLRTRPPSMRGRIGDSVAGLLIGILLYASEAQARNREEADLRFQDLSAQAFSRFSQLESLRGTGYHGNAFRLLGTRPE